MVDFDYFKAPSQPFDFSPITRGEEWRAQAVQAAAAAIGQAFIRKRKMAQQQHQFEVKTQIEVGQQAIQTAREKELERHNSSMEMLNFLNQGSRGTDAAARNATKVEVANIGAQSRQTVADTNIAGRKEMLGERMARDATGGAAAQSALGAGGLQLPEGTGAAVGARHIGALGQILSRMQEASRKVEAFKGVQTDTLEGIDQAENAGTITKEQAAGMRVQVQAGKPEAAASGLASEASRQAKLDEAEMHRNDTVKFLQKQASEARANGNMKLGTELFADAAMLQNFHGPHLMDKAAELYGKAQGIGATVKEPPVPKLLLPSAKQVPDQASLAGGGTFDSMTMEQKNMLQGLGLGEAQKDPRWKVIDFEESEALAKAKKAETTPDTSEFTNRRNLLIAEHGNAIAAMHGWHAAGQPAPAAAPDQSSADSADTLKADILGKKVNRQQAIERAMKLGISPEDLKKLLGGG